MEQKKELKSKLMNGISAILMRDELEVEQQLEVLTDAYADVVRFHATAILGQDGDEYLSRLCAERLHKVEIPLYGGKGAMECLGNHRSADGKRKGGRVVMPDEANSWLRVFPSPLSADELIKEMQTAVDEHGWMYVVPEVAIGSDLGGVLLTSMPESDRKDCSERMKAQCVFRICSGAEVKALRLVVFGAGMQASSKTDIIKARLEQGEQIRGVYFEDWLEILDWIDAMKVRRNY